jgi:hypothetical protein
MAVILEVWVTQPGDICAVSSEIWALSILDHHEAPLTWGENNYQGMPAPAGHWVGEVPPGRFIVFAERRTQDKPVIRSAPAVAQVSCGHPECVYLYIAPDSGKYLEEDYPLKDEKPKVKTKERQRRSLRAEEAV